MPRKKEEIVEEVAMEEVVEKKEGLYYVYDQKYNIYSAAHSEDEAIKLAESIKGSYKKLK